MYEHIRTLTDFLGADSPGGTRLLEEELAEGTAEDGAARESETTGVRGEEAEAEGVPEKEAESARSGLCPMPRALNPSNTLRTCMKKQKGTEKMK